MPRNGTPGSEEAHSARDLPDSILPPRGNPQDVEATGDGTRRIFLVERFVPGGAVATAREHACEARVAAEAANRIQHVTTILLPDDESSFCLFRADSIQEVRLLNDRACLPYVRIVRAVTVSALPRA